MTPTDVYFNEPVYKLSGHSHRVLNRILKIGVKCCPPEKVGVYHTYLLRLSKKLESEMKSWSNLL